MAQERWVVNGGKTWEKPSAVWIVGNPTSACARPRFFSLRSIITACRPSTWRERPLSKKASSEAGPTGRLNG